MVDYNELRKKFPAKTPGKAARAAKIKAIAREYERKRAELAASRPPVLKKGIVFYAVVVIGLLMVGSLVLSATGRGGRAFTSKAHIQATNSVEALAVALGRYRYHTGTYPTTGEGLRQLAAILPGVKGWNGPYIKRVVKDPWGKEYEYVSNGANETPTLYSCGADRTAGTSDDIMADPASFDKPFRDKSWLKGWMPYNLRGYIVVDDEEMKKSVNASVAGHMDDYAKDLNPKAVKHDAGEIIANAGVTPESLDMVRERPVGSMVFIEGCWNHEEGSVAKVVCSTKADEVELFLDNVSLGRKKAVDGAASWEVPFSPGELKAISYVAGRPNGHDSLATALSPAGVVLESKSSSIAEGGSAVAFARVVDRKGNVVPHPDWSRVELSCEGPGKILRPEGRFASGSKLPVAVVRVPGSGVPVKLTASFGGGQRSFLVFGTVPSSREGR
jgi:type II secretion system protein G